MLHSSVISVLFSLACIFESAVGLMQVTGHLESHHAFFALTGTFENPGPYGGFIAMTLAASAAMAWRRRKEKGVLSRSLFYLGLTATATGLMVLPATMSRGAWLALAVAGIVFGFRELNWKAWWRQHRPMGWLLTGFILASLVGIFYLKTNSALGRLHIWQMDIRALFAHPWTGAGAGRTMGLYGETQAAFFSDCQRELWRVRVAGSPEYPFNDYFGLGMEYGLPAMLIGCILVSWIAFRLARKGSPLFYSWLVLAIFALSSYPLSLWSFRIAAVFMATGAFGWPVLVLSGIAACWLVPAYRATQEAEERYVHIRSLSTEGMEEAAAQDYSEIYCKLQNNYRYLYDYGYALFHCGKYEEAIPVLQEGACRSSDPMFWNIIGRCHERMGRYEAAEECWLHAWHMVPGRLYPLVLLKEMHERLGQQDKADGYRSMAQKVPLNPNNRTMMELYERLEK